MHILGLTPGLVLHFVVSPASPSVLQVDRSNIILPSLSFPVASFWPTLGYKCYLTKSKLESENNHITTFPTGKLHGMFTQSLLLDRFF